MLLSRQCLQLAETSGQGCGFDADSGNGPCGRAQTLQVL
jgi:hypothetical protein